MTSPDQSADDAVTRRALVTGAAGFIGSNLVDLLLDEGWDVEAIDNFDDSYSPSIKRRNVAQHLERSNYHLHEVDIRDLRGLQDRLSGPIEVVAHLAGKAGPRQSLVEPKLFEEVNIGGTREILELCRRYGIPRVVFASSSSVYGLNDSLPWSEDAATLPISPYAVTKLSAELLGHAYVHLHGIRFTALRFFTVFGPRQRPGLAMHNFAKRMLSGEAVTVFGDGTAKRDFTYVGDIVAGIRAAMDYDGPPFEIFNLGSNRQVTVLEMLSALERAFGITAKVNWSPPQDADIPASWADCSKAKALLGYGGPAPFDESVSKFAAWMIEQTRNAPVLAGLEDRR